MQLAGSVIMFLLTPFNRNVSGVVNVTVAREPTGNGRAGSVPSSCIQGTVGWPRQELGPVTGPERSAAVRVAGQVVKRRNLSVCSRS